MVRSLKDGNYLVIETQAQGFPGWTPYKGQLRLQAYSHIASGANSVMYWHWHSIHNAQETYWKGILSHDFQENAVYREACVIGWEFDRIGSRLVNLKKKNNVAVLVSNETQPRILKDCLGIHYDQFTYPRGVGLTGEVTGHGAQTRTFMELLAPDGADLPTGAAVHSGDALAIAPWDLRIVEVGGSEIIC